MKVLHVGLLLGAVMLAATAPSSPQETSIEKVSPAVPAAEMVSMAIVAPAPLVVSAVRFGLEAIEGVRVAADTSIARARPALTHGRRPPNTSSSIDRLNVASRFANDSVNSRHRRTPGRWRLDTLAISGRADIRVSPLLL